MTDCVVNINLTTPVAGGDPVPAVGYIRFTPTKRVDLEGEVVLPASFKVRLVDGEASVTLAPTVEGEWAWRIGEFVQGGRLWYAAVPNGPGPVDYDDLVEVDEATLVESAPIAPVWKAYVDAADATLTTAVGTKATTAALTAETTARTDADTALDGRLDTLETQAATFGDIITRDAAEFTTDAAVAALVAAELVDYQPGLEIGYAERTTSATSTQTAPNATGTISGLSVTVVGSGRPVDIRFNAALSWSSVANKTVFTSLMVNGVAGGAASGDSSPVTTTGPTQHLNRRMVLTNGVSYTFTVALYVESGGGTGTAFANATYPMSLSVTNR